MHTLIHQTDHLTYMEIFRLASALSFINQRDSVRLDLQQYEDPQDI